MKSLLLFLAFFCTSAASLQAQTAEQTLEWLNTKKDDISTVRANTVIYGKLEMTDEIMKAYDDKGAYLYGKWSAIKDIKTVTYGIKIVFNDFYNGKNRYIEVKIFKTGLLPKYFNALRHMATLKGAKLVEDDLF